jgi:hypothetical protein
MALNDEKERLDLAEEWLLAYPASSQEFEAALEHVRWVHVNKSDWRARCEAILANVVTRRRDEQHTMSKLKGGSKN